MQNAIEVHPLELYKEIIVDLQTQKKIFTRAGSSTTVKNNYKQVISKIFDIGGRWNLENLTIHIAIKMFFHYAWLVTEIKNRELLALTLLFISAKFNERDEVLIWSEELIQQAIQRFSEIDITEYEREVLNKIEWNLHYITPLHWAQHFVSTGILYESDKLSPRINKQELIRVIVSDVYKSCDFATKIEEFTSLDERIIALSCVVYARQKNGVIPSFHPNFCKLYQISEEMILDHVSKLKEISEMKNDDLSVWNDSIYKSTRSGIKTRLMFDRKASEKVVLPTRNISLTKAVHFEAPDWLGQLESQDGTVTTKAKQLVSKPKIYDMNKQMRLKRSTSFKNTERRLKGSFKGNVAAPRQPLKNKSKFVCPISPSKAIFSKFLQPQNIYEEL